MVYSADTIIQLTAGGQHLPMGVCEFVTDPTVREEDTLPRPQPDAYIDIWMKPPGSSAERVDDGVRRYTRAVAESTYGVGQCRLAGSQRS